MAIEIARRAPLQADNGPTRSCVMECGRLACGMRVDKRDLCAHCFMVTVEVVAHELAAMRRADLSDTDAFAKPDPELWSAIGRVTLPAIDAIARTLGNERAAHGERRGRDDPNPAMCDDDR